jgi:hypothetical protein
MCILCSPQLLLSIVCTFRFHDTEHLSTPAVYLILPESVWEGYSHLVQRGFFSLGTVHTFTNKCMFNDILPGRLLATERIRVTRNGESQNLVPKRGTG